METREVKDAKFDGKKIYYKGHAKATYMSDGRTVEDAINSVSGGGSSGGGSGVYVEVNHGTSDTTFTLTPNTFHVWDEVASLDLSLGSETAGVANEFLFQFTSGTTPTTLTLPDSIKWANGNAPSIASNKIYQISVLKGLGSVLEFENVASTIEFEIFHNGEYHNYRAENGMKWEEWVNSEYNTDNARILASGIILINSYAVEGVGKDDVIIEGNVYSSYYLD